MYDYMLEEMAETIARELHIDHNDVLSILNRYWQDKIAHVWRVEHVLACAHRMGKPITSADALELLHEIFQDHNPDVGISGNSLEIELQEYHLNLKRLTEDQYIQVEGVFMVWRQGNPIAHQIGLFPDLTCGNLPRAIALAKSLADEEPGVPVLIGCEPRYSEAAKPWLAITRVDDRVQIEEGGEPCTP